MWAISVTDFFQSILTISGLLVLAFILSQQAGGVANVLSHVPPQNFKFLPAPDFKEIVAYFAAWSVLGLGSIPSQDVFQRVTSSNSATTAVRSCFIAAFLYLTVAMLPLFISLCIKQMYPHQTGDLQMALPRMVLAHTALPIQILFFGSLLSAVMSTTSSSILAPAAIFSENIVRPLIKRTFSDHQMLMLTRFSVLLFAVLATVMACLRSNIYHLVGESSILSLVSLFAPLVLGLYWKKASPAGALLSMVLGISVWIVFEFYDTTWPGLVPALLTSVLAMIAGSYLWPKQMVIENGNN
jgi:Na+/proline symporter